MDIEKLCGMQAEFDNKVIAEKNIVWTEEERFRNTLVALDVELSEFANEGRWFKRWSEDQEPRILGQKVVYDPDPRNSQHAKFLRTNPLLEEFADAVHFFLSIANQGGWHEELYLYEEAIDGLRESGFSGGMNGVYLEIKFHLGRLLQPDKEDFIMDYSLHQFHFQQAWFCFIALGIIGFDFSWEDIEEAYYAKNKVNHTRQANGY